MRIKNEYVEIKIGNKIYKKQNMILNTYLYRLFNSQISTSALSSNINRCYIKLDTPIENVDYNTELNGNTDFDIILIPAVRNEKIASIISSSSNYVKLKYSFNDNVFKYNNKTYYSNDFSMFNKRKITAIGFGNGYNCFAFLDTNNMNIVINGNEKTIITRVDNFMSDGSSKDFDYPFHLIQDAIYYDLDDSRDEFTKAQLYSIGFGNTAGYMEEEYLINNVETDINDNSITFNVNRTKKLGHYPSEDLHFTFYPTMDNSKYLIFKYRLYRRYYNSNTEQFVITYLDKYYTMSKLNENFGNLEIKLKIER